MTKQFIYNFLLIIFTFCLKSQSLPCYFQKDTGSTNSEISQSAIELRDGNIYVTGIQSNGPFGNDDIALLKFDTCGTILWIKYFGDTLINDALFINKTLDEKLIIVGQTQTPSDTNAVFLYKLDTAGNILFKKQYATSVNQSVKYVQQTSDKGFLMCGYISDASGNNNSYTLKTDSLGNVMWQQQIGGGLNKYAQYARETTDKNFIVVGDANRVHSGVDVEVIKMDKNGNVLWDNYFGDNLNNGSQGIIELSNGNYLFYGETEIPSSVAFDFFIETTDTAGNDFGRHVFGGAATDALFSLVETTNMNLICTGYSCSYNGGAAYDIVLFKTDTTGQIKWLKNIYSPGIDIGYEILQSAFGGYLITGLFAKNNDNYLLTRIDTIANTSVEINNISKKNEILLYPNPCNETFYINIPAGIKEPNIEIINLLGETLKSQYLFDDKNSIDVRELSSGIYTVQVKSEKNILIIKKLSILE